MRLTGSGRARGGADHQFRRVYGGTSGTLRDARNDVVGWLEQHGLAEDLVDRAALVVSELATNAVQAAPGSDYGVQLSLAGDRSAIISVTSHTDYEQPPPREHWRPSSVLAPRGRGLLIVSELAQDVAVDLPSRDTVVVTATLR
jgi:anti-sigma regulatory factor (Ser/Thr protein kinase)